MRRWVVAGLGRGKCSGHEGERGPAGSLQPVHVAHGASGACFDRPTRFV